MLTNEQISNLKPGDPILIHTTFDSLSESGNIRYFSSFATEKGDFITDCRATAPVFVSLLPKHDPCRLFRKGDKVRVVAWNGRKYFDIDHHTMLETGCFAEIWEDEAEQQEEGYVSVIYQEYVRCVPPCYLELITPVEDLEPYSIDPANTNIMLKRGKKFAIFEDDDEAQELCDRLNAECRKEQK